MKAKIKFFSLFQNKHDKNSQQNQTLTFTDYLYNNIQPTNNPTNGHTTIKIQQPSPNQPDGDINMTDPSNDISLTPESFHRLKGFSVIQEDVGFEKKYDGLPKSFYVSKRTELFNQISTEMANNGNSFGLSDSDKSKTSKTNPDSKSSKNTKILEQTKRNKTNNDSVKSKLSKHKSESIDKQDDKKTKNDINDPNQNKLTTQIQIKPITQANDSNKLGIFQRFLLFFKKCFRRLDSRNYKWRDIIKPLFICYLLSFTCSIYQEIYVGLLTGIILAVLLANMMITIYEEVINELQYIELLKDLQMFKIDKERKLFVKENMKIENQEDFNFCKKMCLIGSPILGLAVFPLLLTSLYSFAVILQCFIICLYFIIICLIFRYKNNKKVYNFKIRERSNTNDFRLHSRLALKDLSSSYLRFLQDFEKTKTKILEKSNQSDRNSVSNINSYLTKKTLEMSIQRTKLFNITYRSIFESFFCFVSAIFPLYLNYIMIYACLNREDLIPLLSMVMIVIFLIYRQMMRYVFHIYLHYAKIYKIFRSLVSLSVLFPYKLMIFLLCYSSASDVVNDVLNRMITIFMIKEGIKILAYFIMGIIWFKFKIYISKNETKTYRKNKRKKDKTPESMAGSQFYNESNEYLKENLEKQGKDFAVSFFVFNISDYIITLLIFICSSTLRYIPLTRWNGLNPIIYEGYIQYVGVDLGVDMIIIVLLYFFLKRFSPAFDKKNWIFDGINFLKKRGEIYIFGLYFMFYINFYCFELFFLLPFNAL